MTQDIEQAGFSERQIEALNAYFRRQSTQTSELSGVVAQIEAALEGMRQRLDSAVEGVKVETAGLAAEVAHLREFQSSQRLSNIRREIRQRLSDQRNSYTTPQQPVSFDWIFHDGLDPAALTRRDLYLDEEMLDLHYVEASERVGVVKPNAAWRFGQQVTSRIGRRLAARFAEGLGVAPELLAEALHFPIWGELMRMIPARHLARRIARRSGGDPVLIPLNTQCLVYLQARELEPFYLAAELRRRHIPVAFVCTDPDLIREAAGGAMALRFEPNPLVWAVPALPNSDDKRNSGPRAAVIGSGIRGVNYILKHIKNPLTFRSAFPMNGNAIDFPDQSVLDPNYLPVGLSMPFRRVGGMDHVLNCTLPHGDFAAYLISLLGGVLCGAFARTRELVRSYQITEAHICEHPFFEPAILAHAVREAGGKVVMWPHGGCGLSWLGYTPRPGTVHEVFATNEPAAASWRQALPAADVKVVSELYFPRYRGPRPDVPGAPLEVVVIGTPYTVGRLPYINRQKLNAICSKLYGGLAELAPEVQWIYRAKERNDLFQQWKLNNHSPEFRHASAPPELIDLPNMVFLFPGLLSTALIEGIIRGIPAIIAREDDEIEDYVGDVVPPCVPMGDADFVIAEIARCRDPLYRQSLIERQAAWCEENLLRWQ